MRRKEISALFLVVVVLRNTHAKSEKNYDPCCSFPCENFGICNRIGFTEEYNCDCHGTEHYGNNCETPTWGKWLYELIRPSPYTVQAITTNGEVFWKIVNNIKFAQRFFMKLVLTLRLGRPHESYNTAAEYITWEGYANKSYWGLALPPVPKNCPTPMGIAGPKVLPDAKDVVERVFTRTEFKPCPRGTSLLLPTYGQHLIHQFFKSVRTNRKLTWGSHRMDLSHIYGETLDKQSVLRSKQGGKMKMQTINGEEYPPNVKDCPGIEMPYPAQVKQAYRFAMGNPFFALLPGLLYFSTILLREHNRICDTLVKEHPHWDDERLFQTARLVVLGELSKVSTEAYAQYVSGMHFQMIYDPDVMLDFVVANSRLPLEFDTLYHWHNTMPDYFLIGGKNYTLEETFYNMAPLMDHGTATFTTSLASQVAGRGAGGRNMPRSLLHVAEQELKTNREVRLQPFNRYRKYFRLPPYKTFEELTGEKRLAKVLSDIYDGDIDAVEFFIGILIEKRLPKKMWGVTHLEMIGVYALRLLFSNTSPEFWRESTYGGNVGLDIVKTANIEDLFCRNIAGCPKFRFQIPEMVTEDTDPGMVYDDLKGYETPGKLPKIEL